jgi:hypothetical protein
VIIESQLVEGQLELRMLDGDIPVVMRCLACGTTVKFGEGIRREQDDVEALGRDDDPNNLGSGG